MVVDKTVRWVELGVSESSNPWVDSLWATNAVEPPLPHVLLASVGQCDAVDLCDRWGGESVLDICRAVELNLSTELLEDISRVIFYQTLTDNVPCHP